MRLNKYIASAGVCSRRKADELIKENKVKVNGLEVLEMGYQVVEGDVVEVDGQIIKVSNRPFVYIMLNKPTGFITTASDDMGRPTVFELLGDMEERIFPVGRLDYNTSGLLIFTNDGEFSNLMMHPKNNVYKTYIARVKGIVTHTKANILRKGVIIDGRKTEPALVEIEHHGEKSTIIEIKIHEGRNRQIRKMCEAIGHPVLELHRAAIGNLTLGHLKVGHYKKINPADIAALVKLANSEPEELAAVEPEKKPVRREAWAKSSSKQRTVGRKKAPSGKGGNFKGGAQKNSGFKDGNQKREGFVGGRNSSKGRDFGKDSGRNSSKDGGFGKGRGENRSRSGSGNYSGKSFSGYGDKNGRGKR